MKINDIVSELPSLECTATTKSKRDGISEMRELGPRTDSGHIGEHQRRAVTVAEGDKEGDARASGFNCQVDGRAVGVASIDGCRLDSHMPSRLMQK